jgi:hypothetical protein
VDVAARPESPLGGVRLMETEAHTLVVSAEGKPAEARSSGRGSSARPLSLRTVATASSMSATTKKI